MESWVNKQVSMLATEVIKENSDNAELKRIILPLISYSMNTNRTIEYSARKLGTNGVSIKKKKIHITTREGWSDNSHGDNDYDFFGIPDMAFLSENTYSGRKLSFKVKWDIRDIENLNVENIVSKTKSAFFDELPNIINRKLMNMIHEGLENGIANDEGTDIAYYNKINFSLATDVDVKDFVFKLKNQIRSMALIDNPIALELRPSDFLLFHHPLLTSYLENDAAYNVVGGDKSFEAWRGGEKVMFFAGAEMMEVPKMTMRWPVMIIRKNSYFFDFAKPTARSAYIGSSDSQQFMKTTIEYAYKVSYWYTKFEGIYVFENTTDTPNHNVDVVRLEEGEYKDKDGTLLIDYKMVGTIGRTFRVELVDRMGYTARAAQTFTLADDGNGVGRAEGTITYVNLPSFTYRAIAYEDATNLKIANSLNIQVQIKDKTLAVPYVVGVKSDNEETTEIKTTLHKTPTPKTTSLSASELKVKYSKTKKLIQTETSGSDNSEDVEKLNKKIESIENKALDKIKKAEDKIREAEAKAKDLEDQLSNAQDIIQKNKKQEVKK